MGAQRARRAGSASSPARWYWYRFSALGEQSAAGRTRTAPAADAPATLRFAIASCQRYDVGHYAAWRHAAAENLDLVLFLGDYIYEYAERQSAVRAHEGGEVVDARPSTAPATPPTRATRSLQAAHAPRRGC